MPENHKCINLALKQKSWRAAEISKIDMTYKKPKRIYYETSLARTKRKTDYSTLRDIIIVVIILGIGIIVYSEYKKNPDTSEFAIDENFMGDLFGPERKNECLEAFDYLNGIREANDREKLVWDDRIYALAVFRSKDMKERNYIDHITPEGKCAVDFKSDFNITEYGVFAENVGGTTVTYIYLIPFYAPVKESVDGWMGSRGHRYALLYPYPDYKKAAMGCYYEICVFLVLTTEPFQCVRGEEGLEYWEIIGEQPGEINYPK